MVVLNQIHRTLSRVWNCLFADTVVNGYKKVENTVVKGYKKIEDSVVSGYTKIEDKFVSEYLTHDGETVEEAKKRLKKEQLKK